MSEEGWKVEGQGGWILRRLMGGWILRRLMDGWIGTKIRLA